MSKIMQNLVVLMEPSDFAWRTSLKGGNMILNRFCINEDAAFELAGVNYLKITSVDFGIKKEKRKEKGKEYSFFTILLYCMYCMRNSTLKKLTLISINN